MTVIRHDDVWLLIPDPTHHTMILVAQMEAALMGRCSVCETPTDRDALDASARCAQCAP
jgi:hypothetical protein